MSDRPAENFTEDWDSLTASGRAYFRGVYRSLRAGGGRTDRDTARKGLAAILHVARNRGLTLNGKND